MEQRIEEALLAGGYEKRTMGAYDKEAALDVPMLAGLPERDTAIGI